MMTTTANTTPKIAATHRTPDIIVVMLETISAGGGDTSGFCAVDLWIDWLIICDMVPDIQKGMLNAYRPDTAYHAATAYCIGFVHGVGRRRAAVCWYEG